MAYPERLLNPGEEVVREFRPHWQFLMLPAMLFFAAVVVVAIVLAFVQLEGGARWLLVLGVVVLWIILSGKRIADWLTTQHVITTERVIYRAGVFAREGIEIPLEKITNVAFNQSLVERFTRAGDLVIESAGETGRSRYADIPDPEGLQSLIYRHREKRTVALARSGSSVADELSGLQDLRERGVLTEEEFEAQKRRLLEG